MRRVLLFVGLVAVTAVIAVGAGGAQAAGGALDPSFGRSGKVVTAFAKVWAMGQGVAVQADGKIVAAGFTGVSHYSLDVALVRYTTAGTLDPTFGRRGKVVTDFVDDGETASAVAIQQDGRIVIGGRSGLGGCAVVRYTNAGLLDRI